MWSIVTSVFGGASTISLIIMLVVAVASGLVLRDYSRIVGVTLGALIIVGLLIVAYPVVQGTADPGALPTTAWSELKGMTVGNLVVEFIAFAIVIYAVHLISSTVAASRSEH
jgi:Na+/citrate or Na+/malate symporter